MYSPTKIRINIESPSHFSEKKRKLNEKKSILNKKASLPHHAIRQPPIHYSNRERRWRSVPT